MEILVVTAFIVMIFMVIAFANTKKKLGPVRCRRCGHVGPVKSAWKIGRGMVPVCAKCNGEDWTVVENH